MKATASDGSMNYECRQQEGWVEGGAKYASTEPHHRRNAGGSWSYVQMYSAARESLLASIIDEDGDAEPGAEAVVYMVDEWPAISDDWESDWKDADAKGRVAPGMWRQDGTAGEVIPLADTEWYEVYCDGYDHVERKGDDDARWVAHYSGRVRRRRH